MCIVRYLGGVVNLFILNNSIQVVIEHAFNHSTQRQKQAWSTEWALGNTGLLHRETLFEKPNNNNTMWKWC